MLWRKNFKLCKCVLVFQKKRGHFNLESIYLPHRAISKKCTGEILKQEKGGKKDLKFAKMGEMVLESFLRDIENSSYTLLFCFFLYRPHHLDLEFLD